MITPPKIGSAPKIKTIALHQWLKGRRSDTDITRTANDALAVTDNVQLEQDGGIRPRPSLVPYGTQPVGSVLGIDELTRIVSGVAQTWLVSVQDVAGTRKVYVNKDGGSWQVCEGATYQSASATFVQGASRALILNGKDYLSYLDTTDLSVHTYNSISTPSTPSVTPTNFGAGTALTYRWRVSATTDVGETPASTAITTTTSISRDQWTQSGVTPVYATISWSAVTGANGYCVYVGTEAGKEYFIGTVPAGTTSYVDDGSAVQIVTKLAPIGDSTRGPIASRGANVGGQIFLVGDPNNPYRVWFGGTGDDTFDFSAFNGGGWIDIAVGSKNIPISVVPFRDGKGTPMATVFSKGTNGNGKITHLSLQTANVGDTVITYMQADEANGQDGTEAPDAIITLRDSLWYPSGSEFKTTGTKPQVQNILSTTSISDAILDDTARMNRSSMAMASGVGTNGKLHWALPVGATENNQIWTLDLVRGGQWMLPWAVFAKKLLLYGSNDGETHFLALVGDRLLEFSRARATEDDGTPFQTKVGSGYIKADPSGANWMYVIDVTFTLINPQGTINLSVNGKTKQKSIATIGAKQFVPQTSYAGWGELKNGASSRWGDVGWGEVLNVPTVYGYSRVVRTIPVKKVVNYLQWQVSGVGNHDYIVSDVVIRYVDTGMIITQDMRL